MAWWKATITGSAAGRALCPPIAMVVIRIPIVRNKPTNRSIRFMDSPQPSNSGEPITPELSESTLKFASSDAQTTGETPVPQIEPRLACGSWEEAVDLSAPFGDPCALGGVVKPRSAQPVERDLRQLPRSAA